MLLLDDNRQEVHPHGRIRKDGRLGSGKELDHVVLENQGTVYNPIVGKGWPWLVIISS